MSTELRGFSFHEQRLQMVRSLTEARKYTEGYCGEFALALHSLSPSSLRVAMLVVHDDGSPVITHPLHAVCIHYSGLFVDVNGWQSEAEFRELWSTWLTPGEEAEIVEVPVPWHVQGWFINQDVLAEAKAYILTRDDLRQLWASS
jgi:hypothetical protein